MGSANVTHKKILTSEKDDPKFDVNSPEWNDAHNISNVDADTLEGSTKAEIQVLCKGDKGDPGDTGPQGPQGTQGIQGETGPQGEQGIAGETGPAGSQGEQGIQGIQGPEGSQGLPGDVGPKGDKGDTGDTGPPGTTLHSGLTDVTSDQHHAKVHGSAEHSGTIGTASQVGLGNVTDNAQIAKSIGTAKGDLIAFSASGTPVRLGVGSNSQVLSADSSQSAGVKWVTPEGGGGGVSPVPTYSWNSGGVVVNVNTVLMDLFNASGSGKIVRIFQIEAYQRNTAGVTGVSITLEAYRTTDEGTGGTAKTADKMDTTDADVPAEITCRALPTGGATPTGNAVAVGNIYTEEGVNNQPQVPLYENSGTGSRTRLTLREGEGIHVITGPLGAAGTIALRISAEVS